MLQPRFVAWMIALAMMVLCAGVVCGQPYPSRPIRIVASGLGGGVDIPARIIAQGLTGPLGQAVIVENRIGNLSAEIVAKAPSDGYTLLAAGGSFTTGPLMQKSPYDPVSDFAPISIVSRAPQFLVVHPSLPVNSVKELIALAKARPGELNYTTSATGSSGHIAAELLKTLAGVNIVRISYKSSSQEITDVLSGQVQLTFSNPATALPLIKSGKLKALAITSAQPSALAPGLPMVATTLPGFEVVGTTGLLAPAKTAGAIINQLNQEIVRILNQADVKQKFVDFGIEAVGSSPQEYAAKIKAEIARLSKVILETGIRAD